MQRLNLSAIYQNTVPKDLVRGPKRGLSERGVGSYRTASFLYRKGDGPKMPWAVARTERIREKTAQAWLDRAGFGTYLPMVASSTRNMPLFPSYVPFEYGVSWSPARWQPGVVGIIMAGDRPAVL